MATEVMELEELFHLRSRVLCFTFRWEFGSDGDSCIPIPLPCHAMHLATSLNSKTVRWNSEGETYAKFYLLYL